MILACALGGVVAAIAIYVKKWQAEKAKARWARQLRQSLQNIVHALKVGTGLLQALEYATQECEEPLAGEWRRLLQGIKVGQSMAEALQQLVLRVPTREIGWFAAAVQITQSTGGSLADVLESLATTLQEQQTLREKVAALTAQGKASGILLSALPFLMTGALWVIAPDMIRPMFVTTLGQIMLTGVLISITLGTLVIQRIVNVRVD